MTVIPGRAAGAGRASRRAPLRWLGRPLPLLLPLGSAARGLGAQPATRLDDGLWRGSGRDVWPLLLAALLLTGTTVPLGAQAGCGSLDVEAITRIVRAQRLTTARGAYTDDGGGRCSVAFGKPVDGVYVIIAREVTDAPETVSASMRAMRGTLARALPGVGDEAFVTPDPSDDGAHAEIRDGAALVMVQVNTLRGTRAARVAAAADVARVIFGQRPVEGAAAAVVAEGTPRVPDPAVTDPAPPASEPEPEPEPSPPAAADSEPVAGSDDAPAPIAIPPFPVGPADVCAAFPPGELANVLAGAGLSPAEEATMPAPGTCTYTFGGSVIDAPLRVTVHYAGARTAATAAAQVAAIRRVPGVQPLAGVGDAAAIRAASGSVVIAYQDGGFSGLVEVIAPAGADAALRRAAEQVTREWIARLGRERSSPDGDAR